MRCPFCLRSETKVVDSRESDDSVRRRRECLKCEKRFTTYERIESVHLTVVKRDGRREVFSRDKILRGILLACEKRPISRERIEHLIDGIEADLRQSKRSEIPSRSIGTIVMKHLQTLDDVAYVRYASVYRSFKDPSQFVDEIKKLKGVNR